MCNPMLLAFVLWVTHVDLKLKADEAQRKAEEYALAARFVLRGGYISPLFPYLAISQVWVSIKGVGKQYERLSERMP